RAVKPDDMRRGPEGRVKLTDFGIARVASVSNRLTQSGFFVGTPRYSSPEQCRSEVVDGRSDLYSLGVSVYEMLTAVSPFHADTPLGLLHKICQEPPKPLRDVDPSIPEIAARVIERLLEKAARDRYATAPELVQDLEAAIEMLPEVEVKLFDEAPAPASGSPGSDPGPGSTEA